MSRTLPHAVPRTAADIAGDRVSVFSFGAVGDGVHDDTTAVVGAIADLVAVGGGELYFPGGFTYLVNDIALPSGSVPLSFVGDGYGSLIKRVTAPPAGKGWWDWHTGGTSNIRFRGLRFDAGVTSSTGVNYSTFSGDPMHSSLANGTTFWVRGPASNVSWERVWIEHSGGYAILLDARSGGDIKDVHILNCKLRNNRPHVFGTSGGDLSYGSWTGSIHYQMDGVTNTYRVRGLRVEGCSFERGTGNQVWGHAYGIGNTLHERIKVDYNEFVDIGLDAILFGAVQGGTAIGNHFRRIGYVCSDDTSASVPKWLAGAFAVGIDTAGVAKNLSYCNNTFISINGDAINADGLCFSTISGNTGRIPVSGDNEYTEDSIASFGPGGVGANWSQGVVVGNTNNNQGGEGLTIVGNHFRNFGGSNFALYGCRNSHLIGNTMELPSSMNQSPVILGNLGTGGNQRAFSTVVARNAFIWQPSTPQACIVEDSSLGAFSAGDKNWIADNPINDPGGNAFAFLRDANTSSTTQCSFPTNESGITAASAHFLQGEGAGQTSGLKFYYQEGTSVWQHAQLQAYWKTGSRGPLWNVSEGGTGGAITTGARTALVYNDAIATGKGYFDGHIALTDTTYLDADANLLPSTVALLRFKSSVGYFEQSISVSGGARVWQPFAGVPAGSDKQIQYNKTGAFEGDANLTWDYANQVLTLYGKTATSQAALVVGNSSGSQLAFIQSNGGFLTTSTAGNAIQAPNGGVTCKYVSATGTDWNSMQSVNGGVAGLALYPVKSNGYPANPSAGFGGIGYYVGTNYYFWDDTNSTWNIVDLARVSQAAGSDKYVQYNNGSASGIFGGDANFTWDYTNQVLTIYGKTGVSQAGLTVGNSSGSQLAYIQSNGGFVTSSTAGNAIQAPSGGVTSLDMSATDTVWNTIQATSGGIMAHEAFYPRKRAGIGTPVAPVGDYGGFAYYTGSNYFYWDSSAATWNIMDLARIGKAIGSDTQVQYNDSGNLNGSVNFTWDNTNQIVTIYGKTGVSQAALVVGNYSGSQLAYIQSNGGFLTASTAGNAIQAPNGGVTADTVSATSSVFNGLQNSTGGCAANAFYPVQNSTSPTAPTGSFGGFGYKTGSTYWYWNGSAWATVDLSLASGSSSVSSVAGTTNQVLVNGGTGAATGAVTLSTPQDIGITSDVQFNTVALNPHGSAPTSPAGSYGGLGYKTGSVYWYWNGSAYATADFSTISSPPGSDTQMVYNKTGALFADNYLRWDYTNHQIVITGVDGTAAIAVGSPSNTAYVFSHGGFNTDSSAVDAIQAVSGGVKAATVLATSSAYNGIQNSTGGIASAQAFYPQTLGTAPTSPGVGYGGWGHKTGSQYWYWNGSSFATVDLSLVSSPSGSDKQIQYNKTGSFFGDSNFTWDYTNHVLAVVGVDGTAGITLDSPSHTAYFFTHGGYHTDATNYDAIQAPNGGVKASTILATSSAWNGMQNSSGGVAGNAFYPVTNASAPANPSGGYGGLSHNTGSRYWYWNGSTWATIDFLAAGSSSVSASGSDRWVQYNHSGSFAADSHLSWDYTAQTLTITASSSSSAGLSCNGAINVNQVIVNSTAYNSVQSAGGISSVSASFQKYFLMNTNASPAPVSGDTFSANALLYYDNSSGTQYWKFAYGTGTSTFADAFLWTAGIYVSGSLVQVPNGNVTAQGFAASSTAGNAIQAANGGATCKYLSATGTDWNAVQSANGGVKAASAFYPAANASSPTSPGASHGGLSYKTGSQYWYWNGSAWALADLAAIASGGVTSLAAGLGISVSASTGAVTVSNTGVTSLTAGTGISVSASTGGVTLTNSGVVSLNGSTGAVSIAAGTGVSLTGLTISIGQPVGTGNAVTFYSVATTDAIQSNRNIGPAIYAPNAYITGKGLVSSGLSGYNSIQSSSGISCGLDANGGFYVGTTQVINTSLQFTGFSVLTTDAIQSNRSTGPAIYAPNAYIQGKGLVSSGLTAYNSIQSTSGISAGTGTQGGFYVGSQSVIDTSSVFVGLGVDVGLHGAAARAHNANYISASSGTQVQSSGIDRTNLISGVSSSPITVALAGGGSLNLHFIGGVLVAAV